MWLSHPLFKLLVQAPCSSQFFGEQGLARQWHDHARGPFRSFSAFPPCLDLTAYVSALPLRIKRAARCPRTESPQGANSPRAKERDSMHHLYGFGTPAVL
jgi:hypothetical protein